MHPLGGGRQTNKWPLTRFARPVLFCSLPYEQARRNQTKKPHPLSWTGPFLLCGGGGIRTHDTRKRMPVFKTGAFNQALPPLLAQGLNFGTRAGSEDSFADSLTRFELADAVP